MKDMMAWWMKLVLGTGCKISGKGWGSVSITSKEGALLGSGEHSKYADSFSHAMMEFMTGAGEPAKKNCHPACCTADGTYSTRGTSCRLVVGGCGCANDGLCDWMVAGLINVSPADRRAHHVNGRSFAIERDGEAVRVTLTATPPVPKPSDEGGEDAGPRTCEKIGLGADYPTALAAALAADDVYTVINWHKEEGGD